MDQREIESTLDQHMLRLRMVPLAFIGTAFVYLTVSWLLLYRRGFAPIMEIPLAAGAVVVTTGLMTILAGYLISRSMMSRPPDQPVGGEALVQQHFKANVAACALREVAATTGLAMTIMTADITWVAILAGAATFSTLVHFPRRDGVADWMQRQRTAG